MVTNLIKEFKNIYSLSLQCKKKKNIYVFIYIRGEGIVTNYSDLQFSYFDCLTYHDSIEILFPSYIMPNVRVIGIWQNCIYFFLFFKQKSLLSFPWPA